MKANGQKVAKFMPYLTLDKHSATAAYGMPSKVAFIETSTSTKGLLIEI